MILKNGNAPSDSYPARPGNSALKNHFRGVMDISIKLQLARLLAALGLVRACGRSSLAHGLRGLTLQECISACAAHAECFVYEAAPSGNEESKRPQNRISRRSLALAPSNTRAWHFSSLAALAPRNALRFPAFTCADPEPGLRALPGNRRRHLAVLWRDEQGRPRDPSRFFKRQITF